MPAAPSLARRSADPAGRPSGSPGDGIAILGAGLAGLSLAVRLVEAGVRAPITLLEPRTGYGDDRTWGFWETEPHPFAHLVAERWPAWRVRTPAAAHIRRGSVPYVRLPAAAVYRDALARLDRAGNVVRRMGVRVTGVAGAQVALDTGERLHAGVIYDGRPPEATQIASGHGRGPRLLQQFVGRRVRTGRPAFEPGVADLMDFRVSQRHGIAFLYVLPSGPCEALVEATVFAGQPVGAEVLDRLLAEGLAARCRAADTQVTEVLGTERGAIPMVPGLGRTPARAGGTIAIGTRAGAPRGATGYAYLPIQRHVAVLAADAAAGRPRGRGMRGAGTDWLDQVFLRRLLRAPDAGPALLARLFDRVPADRLVRFLMERGGVRDHLAVMSALPTLPLLREALAASAPHRSRLRPARTAAAGETAPNP
ncbi:lycopene cyclase family protein [Rhodovibrio sodomensis]|nr:lycopene cyclase family protein [Rhodovibrio sodomensis]